MEEAGITYDGKGHACYLFALHQQVVPWPEFTLETQLLQAKEDTPGVPLKDHCELKEGEILRQWCGNGHTKLTPSHNDGPSTGGPPGNIFIRSQSQTGGAVIVFQVAPEMLRFTQHGRRCQQGNSQYLSPKTSATALLVTFPLTMLSPFLIAGFSL